MRKKNVLIVLGLLLLIAALAVAARLLPRRGQEPPAEEPAEARGYVLAVAGSQAYWYALPETGDSVYALTQGEQENVLHLTPEGVYMERSTCANQDCVEQGTVTLENRETRVLGNMIICLPNRVSVELYTPEEIMALLQSGAQGE